MFKYMPPDALDFVAKLTPRQQTIFSICLFITVGFALFVPYFDSRKGGLRRLYQTAFLGLILFDTFSLFYVMTVLS